tara:strand:- start:359 stop:475 length:117 start_codon:yes stop_codon:yes gene_type:complete
MRDFRGVKCDGVFPFAFTASGNIIVGFIAWVGKLQAIN